jgi:DNA-binding GntR family transcriptional regulator
MTTPLPDSQDATLLSERVAEAVRNETLSGQLLPGSRIRQEEIAKRFAVGRFPVRDALQQ